VLEAPRLVDHAIWGVALLLYAWDAARVLGPCQVLLVEGGRGRLAPALGDSPFASGGRTLALGPLHRPHRGAFVAGWGRPWRDEAALAATLASMQRLREALAPLRALAVVGAILLFVAGPALTLALGPDAAVVYTAAGLYPTVLAALATVWWRRHRLGLTRARAARVSLEVLVCPAFLPSLVRTLTGHHPVEADAAQVLLATADAGTAGDLVTRLRRRTEDLLDAGDADPARQAELRAYLAGLPHGR
jgi:hypothetical protein